MLTASAWNVPAHAADEFDWSAPPGVFGATRQLRTHYGAADYRITLKPLGSSQVTGKVHYIAENGQPVSREFTDEITFRTGNVYGTPALQLRGIPTGVVVTVTVH